MATPCRRQPLTNTLLLTLSEYAAMVVRGVFDDLGKNV